MYKNIKGEVREGKERGKSCLLLLLLLLLLFFKLYYIIFLKIILYNVQYYKKEKLQDVNLASKYSYMVTHINKTIIINYNTCREPEPTKGGHKLSTCLKH